MPQSSPNKISAYISTHDPSKPVNRCIIKKKNYIKWIIVITQLSASFKALRATFYNIVQWVFYNFFGWKQVFYLTVILGILDWSIKWRMTSIKSTWSMYKCIYWWLEVRHIIFFFFLIGLFFLKQKILSESRPCNKKSAALINHAKRLAHFWLDSTPTNQFNFWTANKGPHTAHWSQGIVYIILISFSIRKGS